MKCLVFSDVHGSSYYMKKVIDCFEKEGCFKMICLGDLLYHGPRNDLPYGHNPKEVIELVNKYKDDIIMIRGNCEAEVDQMVLDFKIHDEMYLENGTVYLTHGHKINPNNPINDPNVKIVLYGHSHVSLVSNVDDVLYINPGSVSIAKENTPNSLLIYDHGVCHWYNLDEDEIKLYKSMKIK